MTLKKREVVRIVQEFQSAVETVMVRNTHSLAVLRDTHGGTEHSPLSSRPLIRDYLPRHHRKVGHILDHMQSVEKRHTTTLERYAELDSLAKTAEVLGCSKPTVKNQLDCGIAMFQAVWPLRNMLGGFSD